LRVAYLTVLLIALQFQLLPQNPTLLSTPPVVIVKGWLEVQVEESWATAVREEAAEAAVANWGSGAEEVT
jgi:hypothetical protein